MLDERLVHLDLKGAPPKVAYLQAVFPLMRRWGATGLCIEWEDMFPYDGPLRALRGPYAYSRADVRTILTAARRARLTVVPLVQTFGHLEFLLKHPAFAHLREQHDDLQNLCPSQPDAGPVITEMLDQVLALHPDSPAIHLGGDEVRALGTCPTCRNFLAGQSPHGTAARPRTKADLYLRHITPLLQRVRASGLRALIWDDMFRRWPVPKLRALGKLAEPVVWDYGPDLKWTADPAMWRRYARAGIKAWGASAFKGAGGEDIQWPWFGERIANHAAWAKRARQVPLQGIVLTGWSRHSHFYPLCETLPAALPSLALSLDVLRAGRFDDAMRSKRFTQLGIGDMPFMHRAFEDIASIPHGTFPGGDAFSLIGKLQGARQLVNWCEYFSRTTFPENNGGRWNPHTIRRVRREGRLAAQTATQLRRPLERALRPVLFPADIREFLATRVDALIRQARTHARTAATLRRRMPTGCD